MLKSEKEALLEEIQSVDSNDGEKSKPKPVVPKDAKAQIDHIFQLINESTSIYPQEDER